MPALPLLLKVESAHAVDKRPEKDPKTKMAGTSPLLGVEGPHAVDKRAEKDPQKKTPALLLLFGVHLEPNTP
jgi:hypothetical protein